MNTTTIKLSRRYEAPGAEPFDTITLREPTYNDLFMSGLGKPFDFQMAKGQPVRVLYPEVVDQYAQRLVKSPDFGHIGQIAAIDALKLEAAICDFFREPTGSKTSPTS